MAINGINSYGMGYYNYQSSINNMRLSQAISKNPKLQQYNNLFSSSTAKNSLNSSMNFVKQYTSSMSGLMSAANNLRGINASGVMSQKKVTSSNEAVAAATEKFKVKDNKKISLNVTQLAQEQSNVSSSVKASDTAKGGMSFTVKSAAGFANVQVSSLTNDGKARTNKDMLQEAANKINFAKAGVKAKVVEKEGKVSLELTGEQTGKINTFTVNGDFGDFSGLDKTKTEAADAEYSVTENGQTTKHQSATNEISLDFTRIGVSLKSVGETTIQTEPDSEKIVSGVSELVNAYNSSMKFLNDNYDRGTGVERQLRNLVMGLGGEKSLEKLGITVNKDATLKFDADTLKKSIKEEPDLVRSLISGSGGIADTAYSKAVNGINTRSSDLINGDMESMQSGTMSDPINMFSVYAKSGPYTMSNYYAVGMMMNYLV